MINGEDARMNIAQFTEFLTNLSLLSEQKALDIVLQHNADPLAVFKALPAAVRTKADVNINEAQVSAEMKKLIAALPASTKTLYDEFEQLAKNQMVKNPDFQFQALQAYICAVVVDKKSKFTLGSVPSGSGKSMCIMLLAAYYQQKRKKVAVVTSSKLLVD